MAKNRKKREQRAAGRGQKKSASKGPVVLRKANSRSPKGPLLEGVFILTGRGTAFVKVAGKDRDFLVPDRFRGWALPDDKVEIKILPPERKRPDRRPGPPREAAEVVRVLERGRKRWVGRYGKQGRRSWIDVQLGENEIEMELKPNNVEARVGDWVVVSAPGLGDDRNEPEPGELLSTLGGDNTPHLDTLILIERAGLPQEFSTACLKQAESFGSKIPADAVAGRLDLRDTMLFTIDGSDAKDFDDAVSLEKIAGGWKLGVHIADVSHYVTSGSAMDIDAIQRGTSVYLPDRVIPMLPEAISNGLCSLNPEVDRLAMTAFVNFDGDGHMKGFEFHQSVIHSKYRFTYEQVEGVLEKGDKIEGDRDGALALKLHEMKMLAKKRLEQRNQRGGIDFNFPEVRAIVDDQGKPLELVRRERLFAHQLIEEFMLAANEAVATALSQTGKPFLYRIHEQPDPAKLEETLGILARLDVGLAGMNRQNPKPKDLQKLLKGVEGSPVERTAQTLILRSLRLAVYSPLKEGHFGLAIEHYTHFTSPIRRYPDLSVHRMVKKLLCREKNVDTPDLDRAQVAVMGEQCSTLERRAERVERDCIKAKQMRYLEERIGQQFVATVTSVGPFGYFAEIDAFPAEGMVRLGKLQDDLYTFEEDRWRLRGTNYGKLIKNGDKVKIEVERADWEILQADFKPVYSIE